MIVDGNVVVVVFIVVHGCDFVHIVTIIVVVFLILHNNDDVFVVVFNKNKYLGVFCGTL